MLREAVLGRQILGAGKGRGVSTIADSSAFRDEKRVLAQHEAALTLLQGILADPSVTEARWLDLACGRGQIVSSLDQVLSQQARTKLRYNAYDVRHDYISQTARTADALGLLSVEGRVGELAEFSKVYPSGDRFEFITIINVFHELDPYHLGTILADSIARLSDKGCLYVCDMEGLEPRELGAVLWTKDDVSTIFRSLCQGFGLSNYEPAVSHWSHTSRNTWSVQVQRSHLSLTAEALGVGRDAAVASVSQAIAQLLVGKLKRCHEALEALTHYGSQTPQEEAAILDLLYDFWALTRRLEAAT